MNGTTAVGSAYTSSVKAYAEGILDGEYNEDTKALVEAMLNYGAAAQKYFGYKTDALVGTPVTDTTDLKSEYVEPETVEGDGFIGASLVLEGTMRLRFYFEGTVASATVDGEAAAVVSKGGNSYVEIKVTPDNIDTTYEVVAGNATVNYSVLNYLVNNADNAELAEVVASIYEYSVAAEYYTREKTPLDYLQSVEIDVYEYPREAISEFVGTIAYNTDNSSIYNYCVYNEGKTISLLIDVTDTTFDSIHIELADHDNPYLRFAFLAEMPELDTPVDYAEGYCTYKAAWRDDFTLDIPEDAKYLIMGKMDGSYDCTPAKMTFTKGTKALENIQNNDLEEYEYPMENLIFDHGLIMDDGDATTEDLFYFNGNRKISIVDITDCSFHYVSMTINQSFKNKSIRYTFLSELPSWNEPVVYADGYSGFCRSDNGAPITNIEIPSDAKYLVLYYMESYYDNSESTDSRYYPESILFHDDEQ